MRNAIFIHRSTPFGQEYFKVVPPPGEPDNWDEQESIAHLNHLNVKILLGARATIHRLDYDALVGLGLEPRCAHCENRMLTLTPCPHGDRHR